MRTAEQVFEDHLELRLRGRLEEDLSRNYAADVVFLCEWGVLRGHDGVRESAKQLHDEYPGQQYRYLERFVEGEYSFLKWDAQAPDGRRAIGADSFVIREGRIVMQSVYYRAIRAP